MLATFAGTAGDDMITIAIDGDDVEVVINGDSTSLSAPEDIMVDGLAGDDFVTVTRTAGMDATFSAGAFQIGGFPIDLDNVEDVDIDSFDIVGTEGADLFEVQFLDFRPVVLQDGVSLGLPPLALSSEFTIDGQGGDDTVRYSFDASQTRPLPTPK